MTKMALTKLMSGSMMSALLLASCSNEAPQPGQERSNPNEAEVTARMITAIEAISLNEADGGLVKRVNQAKTLGCLDGMFQVSENLPARLRQGLFAQPGDHSAKVRFANASTDDDEDKDFRGMSVKVFDVDGNSLWGENGQQDFLLNSYPALFAGNPDEFLSFLEANADEAVWKFFINPGNWDSVALLLRGRDKISSPFDIRYWSTTPYRFGDDPTSAVKYSVKSCSTLTSDMPDDAGPNFLQANMKRHLSSGDVCFDFMVQFQGDPDEMPIKDASVVWNEEDSSYETVARLIVRDQEFQSTQAMASCENETFNPWQSLAAHQPIGGINRVRRAVYSEAGEFRLEQNQSR